MGHWAVGKLIKSYSFSKLHHRKNILLEIYAEYCEVTKNVIITEGSRDKEREVIKVDVFMFRICTVHLNGRKYRTVSELVFTSVTFDLLWLHF